MDGRRKKAILVVSFGTSHAETIYKTIGAIEKDIAAAYPDYELRRAFTSGQIRKILADRDGVVVDNVTEAMEHLLKEGFHEVIVQPTHVICGDMNDAMISDVTGYKDKFENIKIGHPLLAHPQDYFKVIQAIMSQFTELHKSEAVILMGHGTGHKVNAVYQVLADQFKATGHANVFVGTVEAYPTLDTVVAQVRSYNPKKVMLLPLMIVAGDHACHDMAGDEEGSWKNTLEQAGYEVTCILRGLGEYQAIRDIFLEHIADVINNSQGLLTAV